MKKRKKLHIIRKNPTRNTVTKYELERDVPKRVLGLRVTLNRKLDTCELVWHDGSFLFLHDKRPDAVSGYFVHKHANGLFGSPLHVQVDKDGLAKWYYRNWCVIKSNDLVSIYRNDSEVSPFDGHVWMAWMASKTYRLDTTIELKGNEKVR